MTIKLIITRKSDPSLLQELEFSSFPVILGREENIDVPLPDPLKIISRKHAQIANTEGILQLMDLGSANFTFLNGQKLKAREENPLTTGDKIKIGEYELHVQLINLKEETELLSEDDNKTVEFAGQYEEELFSIADNLKKIAKKYSTDDSPTKSEALRFTIGQILRDSSIENIIKIFSETFSYDLFNHSFDSAGKKTIAPDHIEPFLRSETEKPSSFQKKLSPESQTGISADYPFSSNFTGILDTLLEMFSKMTQGLLYFRQEFFGTTIFSQIPTESLKDLKEFLFNPAVPPKEETKRVELLKEETQRLLLHHIGLLEGYKLSVTEGSRNMLQSLDPENQAGEQRGAGNMRKSFSGGILQSLNKSKKLKWFTEKYKKYVADPYYVEKKFFRPSFIKGYQKRIPEKPQIRF